MLYVQDDVTRQPDELHLFTFDLTESFTGIVALCHRQLLRITPCVFTSETTFPFIYCILSEWGDFVKNIQVTKRASCTNILSFSYLPYLNPCLSQNRNVDIGQ